MQRDGPESRLSHPDSTDSCSRFFAFPAPLPIKVVDDDAECLIDFFQGRDFFQFTPKICVRVVAVHLFPGEWAGDSTASLVNIS